MSRGARGRGQSHLTAAFASAKSQDRNKRAGPAGRGTPTPRPSRWLSPCPRHATRPRLQIPSILHHSSRPAGDQRPPLGFPRARTPSPLSPPTDRSIVAPCPLQQHIISSVAYLVSSVAPAGRPALLHVCGAQLGEHIYLALCASHLPTLAPSCSLVLYLVPTHIHPQFPCLQLLCADSYLGCSAAPAAPPRRST